MINIFQFQDYKAYLRERIDADNDHRGYKKLLSESIGIGASFLSRVLHSSVQLTPEHAVALTRFWNLPLLEAQYFEELVNHARAGTVLLKSILQKRLNSLREQSLQVTDRLNLKNLDETKSSYYYSSWCILAVHVLVSVQGYQSTQKIAERLNLPVESAQSILEQLKEFQLIDGDKENWSVGPSHIHLPLSSPLQIIHQANWKHQAILDVNRNPHSLHYVNVHSLSSSDFLNFKEQLLNFISEFMKQIPDSRPERLACLNLDYFEV